MTAAVVTGISGQDGFYMAKLLRRNGFEVVGLTSDPTRLVSIRDQFDGDDGVAIEVFDYATSGAIEDVLERTRPDLIFNFAAYATGQGMFDDPLRMARLNGYFVLDILEGIRRIDPDIAFCQASSAEMFGYITETPQSEKTALRPKSPYGAAKAYAHNMVGVYRDAFGLKACSAILYNHESPRRGRAFVTRKIARGAAAIARGQETELVLGALETTRDWGYAPEYVEAMFLMATAQAPRDYVLATGRRSTIRNVCEICFSYLGLDYRDFVRIDEGLRRPIETVDVLGDPSLIKADLGWEARTGLEEILREMVDAELASIELCG